MIKTHLTSIQVNSTPEVIWNHITNVNVENFDYPGYLRFLDIPKPLSATVTKEGVGGHRIARFKNGSTFTQEIVRWELHQAYAFKFNADPNFRVAYFFNLKKGPIIIRKGGYELEEKNGGILLSLETTYEIVKARWFLNWLFPSVLKLFANYLLRSIKKQCEDMN